MERREFLNNLALGMSATILNSCDRLKPPNFIVLVADDLRWDCLGVLNSIIQTPNLDRLAHEGILFLNNFVTTSICPTSRASILTGLYARSHGIWDFETPLTAQQWQLSYPYLLQQAGYTTAFIGKWGLGGQLPQDKFDYWAGFAEQGNYFTPTRSEHLTSYLTGKAEYFLSQATTPFCLSLSYKAPHVDDDPNNPFIPDRRFSSLYSQITIPRSDEEAAYARLPEFLQHSEARVRYEQRFATEELFQRSVKNYYRLIAGIDRSVGRIINALEANKLDRNTFIIFTSDNGFFLGEKGLAGKWFGFEPAIRTPLIVYPPATAKLKPSTVRAMTLNIDLAPTILSLAKVKPARFNFMHGRDLRRSQSKLRDSWFYEHLFTHPEIPINVGIRTERYKYLQFPEYNYEMLFDLKVDADESNNLASDKSRQDSLIKLRNLVKQYELKLS